MRHGMPPKESFLGHHLDSYAHYHTQIVAIFSSSSSSFIQLTLLAPCTIGTFIVPTGTLVGVIIGNTVV